MTRGARRCPDARGPPDLRASASPRTSSVRPPAGQVREPVAGDSQVASSSRSRKRAVALVIWRSLTYAFSCRWSGDPAASPTDGHSGIPSGGLGRGRRSRDPPPHPFRRAEGGNTIATGRARRALQGQHDPGSRGVHGRRGPPRPRVFRHAHEEHEAVVAALHAKAPRRARGTFRRFGPRKRSVAQAVSRTGSADPRTTPWTQSLAPTAIRLDSAPGTRARGNDSIGQHTGASRADDHGCEGTESNASPAPLRWHSSQDLRSRGTNVSRRCAPPPTDVNAFTWRWTRLAGRWSSPLRAR